MPFVFFSSSSGFGSTSYFIFMLRASTWRFILNSLTWELYPVFHLTISSRKTKVIFIPKYRPFPLISQWNGFVDTELCAVVCCNYKSYHVVWNYILIYFCKHLQSFIARLCRALKTDKITVCIWPYPGDWNLPATRMIFPPVTSSSQTG